MDNGRIHGAEIVLSFFLTKVAGWVNLVPRLPPFVSAFLPLDLIFRSRVVTRVSKCITLDRYIFRVHFSTLLSIFEHLPVRVKTSSDHC